MEEEQCGLKVEKVEREAWQVVKLLEWAGGPGGGNAAIRSQRPCGSGCIFLQHIPPCCCVFHDKNVITAVPTSIPRGSWLHVQKQLIGLALFAGQVHSKVEKQKWGF